MGAGGIVVSMWVRQLHACASVADLRTRHRGCHGATDRQQQSQHYQQKGLEQLHVELIVLQKMFGALLSV